MQCFLLSLYAYFILAVTSTPLDHCFRKLPLSKQRNNDHGLEEISRSGNNFQIPIGIPIKFLCGKPEVSIGNLHPTCVCVCLFLEEYAGVN